MEGLTQQATAVTAIYVECRSSSFFVFCTDSVTQHQIKCSSKLAFLQSPYEQKCMDGYNFHGIVLIFRIPSAVAIKIIFQIKTTLFWSIFPYSELDQFYRPMDRISVFPDVITKRLSKKRQNNQLWHYLIW